MLKIISHQGNANQNHAIALTPTPTPRMAIIKFFKKTVSVNENVGKLEPSYTYSGDVKWYICLVNQFGNSSKIKDTVTKKLQ